MTGALRKISFAIVMLLCIGLLVLVLVGMAGG